MNLFACVRVYSRINREYISLAKPQGAAEGKHMNAKLPFSAKADFATRAQTTVNNLRTKDSGLWTNLLVHVPGGFDVGDLRRDEGDVGHSA